MKGKKNKMNFDHEDDLLGALTTPAAVATVTAKVFEVGNIVQTLEEASTLPTGSLLVDENDGTTYSMASDGIPLLNGGHGCVEMGDWIFPVRVVWVAKELSWS